MAHRPSEPPEDAAYCQNCPAAIVTAPALTERRWRPLESDDSDSMYRWIAAESARLNVIEGMGYEFEPDDPKDREFLAHILANLRDALRELWSEQADERGDDL